MVLEILATHTTADPAAQEVKGPRQVPKLEREAGKTRNWHARHSNGKRRHGTYDFILILTDPE